MTDVLVLFGVLAIAIERAIEPINNFLKDRIFKGDDSSGTLIRRVVAMVLGMTAGVVVASVMKIDVVNSVIGGHVDRGEILTGLMLGLGTGPVHEIVKYVEEKKNKAKEEVKRAKAGR
ncbi:MAG: hypothetical protein HY682_09600 [Chloroflexi bacterium]|nr:hypothetical protein [Chloroflexota bacterium]